MCIPSQDYKKPFTAGSRAQSNPRFYSRWQVRWHCYSSLAHSTSHNFQINQKIFNGNLSTVFFVLNMEFNCVLRTLCLIILICNCTIGDSTNQETDMLDDSFPLIGQLEKRQSFKKLRSYNPILIYHQSIRQPRYLPRTRSQTEVPASERDIPRRLIRRGNNKTYSNIQPFLVWNHQLLPNFYNKRQPSFLMNSLRRDGYLGKTKSSLAVKRSSDWLPRSYDETNIEAFPYEKLNYDSKDYSQDPDDFNEPDFEQAETKNEDF